MHRSTLLRRLQKLKQAAPQGRINDPKWHHRARRLVILQVLYERVVDRIAIAGAAGEEGSPRRWLETMARFDRDISAHEEFLFGRDDGSKTGPRVPNGVEDADEDVEAVEARLLERIAQSSSAVSTPDGPARAGTARRRTARRDSEVINDNA